ncbi:MAG: permease [Verrucomicrobiota bacterium]
MNWFTFNLQDFSVSFLSILFEGVPFMFLGTLISGIVDAFVSPETMAKIQPRNPLAAIALSGALGVVFPMCECGMVPVIRRMIRKGLPVSCALTYLLAAPIVNPIVAISTFAAFKGQHPAMMMSLRIGMGFVVALVCGLVIHCLPHARILNREMLAPPPNRRPPLGARLSSQKPMGEDSPLEVFPEPAARKSFGGRMMGAARCAAFDFLDVGFYLIIGAAIASVFNTAVHRDAILSLAGNSVVATGSMMILALLLSLCSTSDAFIAASFVGFPMAAKLAFMVFGPMMDVKLLFMYGLVFRKRFTLPFALALFLLIGVLCWGLGLH